MALSKPGQSTPRQFVVVGSKDNEVIVYLCKGILHGLTTCVNSKISFQGQTQYNAQYNT